MAADGSAPARTPFLLRFHIESKEMPVLALVPARTGAVLPPVKPAGATSMTPGEHNQMIFKNITMAGLVNVMSNALHVPVVDPLRHRRFLRFHARSPPLLGTEP